MVTGDIMVIRKTNKGYAIYSKTTGRRLSRFYKSKDSPALNKREKQINYFKHRDKISGK